MNTVTLAGDFTWGYFSILAFFAIVHFVYLSLYKNYTKTLFGNVALLLTSIFFIFLVFTPIIWLITLFLPNINSTLIIEIWMIVICSISSWALIIFIPLVLFIFVLNLLFTILGFFYIAIESFFKK